MIAFAPIKKGMIVADSALRGRRALFTMRKVDLTENAAVKALRNKYFVVFTFLQAAIMSSLRNFFITDAHSALQFIASRTLQTGIGASASSTIPRASSNFIQNLFYSERTIGLQNDFQLYVLFLAVNNQIDHPQTVRFRAPTDIN